MVDVLKIISPVAVNNKINNLPRQLPEGAVFEIGGETDPAVRELQLPKVKGAEEEGGKQPLLQSGGKEILAPLFSATNAQSERLQKLLSAIAVFSDPLQDASVWQILDRFFINPDDLLRALLQQDQSGSLYRGELFDSLRFLARLDNQPGLRDAVTQLLKAFDAYVNRDNSLRGILMQGHRVSDNLPAAEARLLRQAVQSLETALQAGADQGEDPGAVLKGELLPLAGKLLRQFRMDPGRYDGIMTLIHHGTRYEKGDPRRLEEAVLHLGEELKPLADLKKEDLAEMRKLLFDQAAAAREKPHLPGNLPGESRQAPPGTGASGAAGEADLADLLSGTLEKNASSKIAGTAQALLNSLLQSQNPVVPLLHFVLPLRFLDETVYGEFFIDKECRQRKGDAAEAKNIFFTIQSEKYGNFEVDLLERDRGIDLDIRCPDQLLEPVRDFRDGLRQMIRDQGYRLNGFQVEPYRESSTILRRFPRLAEGKAGIDVRV